MLLHLQHFLFPLSFEYNFSFHTFLFLFKVLRQFCYPRSSTSKEATSADDPSTYLPSAVLVHQLPCLSLHLLVTTVCQRTTHKSFTVLRVLFIVSTSTQHYSYSISPSTSIVRATTPPLLLVLLQVLLLQVVKEESCNVTRATTCPNTTPPSSATPSGLSGENGVTGRNT